MHLVERTMKKDRKASFDEIVIPGLGESWVEEEVTKSGSMSDRQQ
jgi:hypothetical protein